MRPWLPRAVVRSGVKTCARRVAPTSLASLTHRLSSSLSDSRVQCRRFYAAAPLFSGAQSQMLKNVVSLLETVGPCPLSKLSTSLDDEVAERIAQLPGGFLSFCQYAPQNIHVVFVDGARKGQPKVPVAIPQTYLRGVYRDEVSLVAYILGLLAVAKWSPASSSLRDSEPLLSDVLVAIHTSSLPVGVRRLLRNGISAVQSLAQRHDKIFSLDARGKRIQLADPRRQSGPDKRGSCSSRPPESSPSLSTPAAPQTRAPHRSDPWLRFITNSVPSTFAVPVTFLLKQRGFARACGSAVDCSDAASLLTFLRASQQRGEVQLVSLTPPASSEDPLRHTYVRSLCLAEAASSPPQQVKVIPLTSAEELADAAGLDPLPLAQAVARVMALYEAEQGNIAKLRLIKGLSAMDIEELLPPDLIARLDAFYSPNANSRGDDVAFYGQRALLLLDRMRHLFDVDLGAMRARPWSVLPTEDLPSSLTLQTTPLPIAVALWQSYLDRHGPQSPAALFADLPGSIGLRLLSLYDLSRADTGAWGASDETRTRIGSLLANVPEATKIDTCTTFLSQHSLYFVEKDGLIYTPQMLAQEQRQQGRGGYGRRLSEDPVDPFSLSETEVMHRVHALLPANDPVALTALFPDISAARLPTAIVTLDTLRRYSNLFTVYEPFLGDVGVVARSSAGDPPEELLQPPLDTVADIVKYAAVKACGGISANRLTMSLPPHARTLLKRRIGSVVSLLEQLPEWFTVRRDVHNEGSSFITYIGTPPEPASDTEERRTLRPMRNVGLRTWRHEPLEVGSHTSDSSDLH